MPLQYDVHATISERGREATRRRAKVSTQTTPLARLTVLYSRSIAWNPEHEKDSDRCRWVENAGCGLRFVGFADDLLRSLNHKGWYTDEHQDEAYRGIVYRLPARHGRNLYLVGYADPCNEGAALLDMDIVTADHDDDGTREAAIQSDGFAERRAEESREWRAAEEEGRRLREALAAALTEAREAVDDVRAQKEGGLVNHEEWRAALNALDEARVAFAEALDNALSHFRSSWLPEGITWDDCAP